MATTCDTIFPLPSTEAGIRIPRPAATFRRPVTANSRPRMIITIQAGTRVHLHQGEEGRRRQQLVGQRIQQDPELRDLVPPPREIAVEVVGQDGQAEDRRVPGRAPPRVPRQEHAPPGPAPGRCGGAVRALGRFNPVPSQILRILSETIPLVALRVSRISRAALDDLASTDTTLWSVTITTRSASRTAGSEVRPSARSSRRERAPERRDHCS